MDSILRRVTRASGWKQSARINCACLLLLSAVLIGCVSVIAAEAGGLEKSFIFHTSSCDSGRSSVVNTALHLLINTISSLMVS